MMVSYLQEEIQDSDSGAGTTHQKGYRELEFAHPLSKERQNTTQFYLLINLIDQIELLGILKGYK